MKTALLIVLPIVSYFIGCFNLSIILSKGLYGHDVRQYGSGNPGATNMARVYGVRMGILSLLSDCVKAFIAIEAGRLLLGNIGSCICGIACLLGHCYPVIYRFAGGKGVSVGATAAFFIDWRVGVIALLVFLLLALTSKRVSLGSVAGALSIPVSAILLRVSAEGLVLGFFCALLVVFRHRENIIRLLNGTEKSFELRWSGQGKS